jgi:hypothetical protein
MSDTGDRHSRMGSDDGAARSALWALVMGLAGLLTAFVVVAVRWNDESGVAALGAVASSIAAILTGYFGIQLAQRSTASSGTGKKRRAR